MEESMTTQEFKTMMELIWIVVNDSKDKDEIIKRLSELAIYKDKKDSE